jgi:hypothetical protein
MTNIIKIKERDCVMFSVYGLMFNGGLGNLGRIGSLRQRLNKPNRANRPQSCCYWERSSEKI